MAELAEYEDSEPSNTPRKLYSAESQSLTSQPEIPSQQVSHSSSMLVSSCGQLVLLKLMLC